MSFTVGGKPPEKMPEPVREYKGSEIAPPISKLPPELLVHVLGFSNKKERYVATPEQNMAFYTYPNVINKQFNEGRVIDKTTDFIHIQAFINKLKGLIPLPAFPLIKELEALGNMQLEGTPLQNINVQTVRINDYKFKLIDLLSKLPISELETLRAAFPATNETSTKIFDLALAAKAWHSALLAHMVPIVDDDHDDDNELGEENVHVQDPVNEIHIEEIDLEAAPPLAPALAIAPAPEEGTTITSMANVIQRFATHDEIIIAKLFAAKYVETIPGEIDFEITYTSQKNPYYTVAHLLCKRDGIEAAFKYLRNVAEKGDLIFYLTCFTYENHDPITLLQKENILDKDNRNDEIFRVGYNYCINEIENTFKPVLAFAFADKIINQVVRDEQFYDLGIQICNRPYNLAHMALAEQALEKISDLNLKNLLRQAIFIKNNTL